MAPYYDHQVGRFEAPRLPDDRERLIARARRARANATADLFKALYSGLKTASRAVVTFFCYAGYGGAWMAPQDAHHGAQAACCTDR